MGMHLKGNHAWISSEYWIERRQCFQRRFIIFLRWCSIFFQGSLLAFSEIKRINSSPWVRIASTYRRTRRAFSARFWSWFGVSRFSKMRITSMSRAHNRERHIRVACETHIIHHGTADGSQSSRGPSHLNNDSRDVSNVSGNAKSLEPKESGDKTSLWGGWCRTPSQFKR